MKYIYLFLIFSLMIVSCTSTKSSVNILTANTESQIRSLLNIPIDAKQVMIVSQSSHWDIDWQVTFNDYYTNNVDPIIKKALDMLDANKGYYYSICEIAFLKQYWDLHPEDHARILKYLRDGQLRIVGGGMTSPDTNLPTGEALIMDWFYGNMWIYNIAGIKPITAWQPDSFGHASSLPDILASLGYKYVGFSRIPGVAETAQWYYTAPPTPGSFAETLSQTGSLDFVWKGLGGSEILAHFLRGGYGDGDVLYTTPFTVTAIDSTFSNLIDQLKPVSPTGYMFLPVGSDFMPPDKYLPQQIAIWNSTMYKSTGVYVTMATFEDYMKLVSFHLDKIPVYSANLNPYFTGYYASRPELKKLAREVTYGLESAQLYSIIAHNAGYTYPSTAFDNIWELFLRSNHHDFIPGTSTNNVYYNEQIPLLLNFLSSTTLLEQSATTYIANNVNTSSVQGIPIIVFNPSGFVRSDVAIATLSFSTTGIKNIVIEDQIGNVVPSQIITATTYSDGSYQSAVVEFYVSYLPSLGYATYMVKTDTTRNNNAGVSVSTDAQGNIWLVSPYEVLGLGKSAGYAIIYLMDRATSAQMISGPSNDIVYYNDTGDLWSIGSEPDSAVITHNGVFSPEYALSQTSSSIATVTANGPLFAQVQVRTSSPYGTVIRTYTMYSTMKRIDLSTTLSAPTGTTVAAVFSTSIVNGVDNIAVPYGIQQEPFQSLYTPSFWPGVEWADLFNPVSNTGVAIFDLGSEMWSFGADGSIILGLVRNPLLTGGSCLDKGLCASDNDVHTLDYAIMPHVSGAFFTPEGYAFSSPLTATVTTNHSGVLPLSFSLASSSNNALITAVKESKNGNGVIMRLFKFTRDPEQVTVYYSSENTNGALVTNSYETPIGKPTVNGSTIGINMTDTISTLFIPWK
ncbi:MAG: hypothetical protein ACP5OF_08545 [bacterium]